MDFERGHASVECPNCRLLLGSHAEYRRRAEVSRLDKIRVQHAEHDMSDSDEAYLLGLVETYEKALRRIAASHGASDHGCFRRDLADEALRVTADGSGES